MCFKFFLDELGTYIYYSCTRCELTYFILKGRIYPINIRCYENATRGELERGRRVELNQRRKADCGKLAITGYSQYGQGNSRIYVNIYASLYIYIYMLLLYSVYTCVWLMRARSCHYKLERRGGGRKVDDGGGGGSGPAAFDDVFARARATGDPGIKVNCCVLLSSDVLRTFRRF